MAEWMKEYKVYLLVGVALVLFFSYAYLGHSPQKEESGFEEELIFDESINVGEPDRKEVSSKVEKPIIIMADIKGEVVVPGVYEVSIDDRIINLIEKAGGLTDDADATAVNFAMKVSDEMAVYIPKKGEEAPVVGAGINVEGGMISGGPDPLVNINSAGVSELETLPGIGPSKSAAIIEFRETNGPYKSIEDLKSISGIGDKTFEKLKELISIK